MFVLRGYSGAKREVQIFFLGSGPAFSLCISTRFSDLEDFVSLSRTMFILVLLTLACFLIFKLVLLPH